MIDIYKLDQGKGHLGFHSKIFNIYRIIRFCCIKIIRKLVGILHIAAELWVWFMINISILYLLYIFLISLAASLLQLLQCVSVLLESWPLDIFINLLICRCQHIFSSSLWHPISRFPSTAKLYHLCEICLAASYQNFNRNFFKYSICFLEAISAMQDMPSHLTGM